MENEHFLHDYHYKRQGMLVEIYEENDVKLKYKS